MAGTDRMTIAEVVREVLRDEHADVIRESVRAVAQELMEAEISELIGAERGERSEDRATHRNGYRPRRWDTRAGEIELQIPRMRQGSYFPSFLQPRKRSEQALVSVVQQAYVCGVSTRRVDQLGRRAERQLVESLGLRISKSEVSRIAGLLDEQVTAFRERPLEGRYPYVFVDAKIEKVRDGGRVARKCVVVAHAVHETGRREIIGLDVGEAETEAFWTEFLRSLVARGLVGVQLAISDAHPGLKAAIARVLGAPWQRCTVHFLRDLRGHCRKDQHDALGALIRQLFTAPDGAEARRRLADAIAQLEPRLPKIARRRAEHDVLAFYAHPRRRSQITRILQHANLGIDVHLPAGDRQRRDHRHRPCSPGTDDPRQRRGCANLDRRDTRSHLGQPAGPGCAPIICANAAPTNDRSSLTPWPGTDAARATRAREDWAWCGTSLRAPLQIHHHGV